MPFDAETYKVSNLAPPMRETQTARVDKPVCILGWAERIGISRGQLGLTNNQAQELFFGGFAGSFPWFPSRRNAVATLNYYLRTGKVCWSPVGRWLGHGV